MCGIAGFLNGALNELSRELNEISSAMNSSLQHRGPDDHGVWIDENASVALVHHRLSILDLSPAGHAIN
jgi:asparagine synthase (glutamine-hydrolysing)